MLNDTFDRAILSGRIPAFKDDQDLVAALDKVPLQLDQLNLKLTKILFISFRLSWSSCNGTLSSAATRS